MIIWGNRGSIWERTGTWMLRPFAHVLLETSALVRSEAHACSFTAGWLLTKWEPGHLNISSRAVSASWPGTLGAHGRLGVSHLNISGPDLEALEDT